MKYLVYLLISPLILSCNSDKGDCCIHYNIGITMLVKSHDGKNLLDPKNPNAFHKNDIQLFYLKKNEKTRSYEFSVGFYDERQEYEIRIVPNTDKEEKLSRTLIQWTKSDTDTIKCAFNRSHGETCTRVWFNGKEKWKGDGTPRFFEIVK